jgi:serine/threonine-protein kinase
MLHRDLKPANVMLGDYGEVWVLDWGLAKLAGDTEIDALPESRRDPSSARSLEMESTIEALRPDGLALPAGTAHGAIMGTPGYMAPEQIRGEADRLDARTDVWALGVLLFEILTRTPLHDRTVSPEKVLLDTLQGIDTRPSTRAPDVAPELEAIVVRATALEPDDRYPNVRALLDDLEAYLDGDRDLERRRELAAVHAERARLAAARASSQHGGEGGDDARAARAEAMREVNRALALDPGHEGALSTMLALLLDPPREIPEEAEVEYAAAIKRGRMESERAGAWAYLAWFVVTPIFLHMGIRSWPRSSASRRPSWPPSPSRSSRVAVASTSCAADSPRTS